MECKKKCTQCCSDSFFVSRLEMFYILYNIKQELGPEFVLKALNQGKNAFIQMSKSNPHYIKSLSIKKEMFGLTNKAYDIGTLNYNTAIKCSFLKDKRCSVYENRPFVCRAYGIGVNYEDSNIDCNKILNLNENIDMEKFYDKYKKLIQLKSSTEFAFTEKSYPIFIFLNIFNQNPEYLLKQLEEIPLLTIEEFADNIMKKANNQDFLNKLL